VVSVDGVPVPTLADIFANSVRAERSRRGLRQADLAARCGWSLTIQGAIERGARQVNLDDIEKLCAALGVPLVRMLDGAEPEQLRNLGFS
jgi:transcriptional regulator with XRE-family HTH domain